MLLIADLTERIRQDEDQVLIVNLGPVEGRASKVVEFLGRTLPPAERGVVVV